jgi:hypothetical protein
MLLLLAAPTPAAAGVALKWTVTRVDNSGGLVGISCPSSSLCVAIDTAGNVVTSSNPTGGAGAWTGAHVDNSGGLQGISCQSPPLCVAVDSGGDVVTSTNPTGGAGAWTGAHADNSGGSVTGISCPSTSRCVAVDSNDNVVTSTDPTGGAGAWTVTSVDTNFFGFKGVSCPSTSLCVAIDGAGHAVTSTDPTGGAGAWTGADVNGSGSLFAVSCPAANLCVASDLAGNVVTSTDPTGGAGAWTGAHADNSGGFVNAISCPSASFCIGTDNHNNVVTSSDPTGGAGAWVVAPVAGASGLQGVSCPSPSLCVAVDYQGNVAVGTPSPEPAGANPAKLVPPAVKILSAPPAETAHQKATFTFRGVAGGAYECSIDNGAWAPCTSGQTFGPLLPGDHLFRVRETLDGLTGPAADHRWTVLLPRACVLRVARARIFVAPKKHKVRLVIHYTSYRPAEVEVSYDLLGSKGRTNLGNISADFATVGVFRDPEILSSEVFGDVRAAKLFKVRFQIAKTPRSCGRYYTKRVTIPKTFSGRTVWFQSDSSFAP